MSQEGVRYVLHYKLKGVPKVRSCPTVSFLERFASETAAERPHWNKNQAAFYDTPNTLSVTFNMLGSAATRLWGKR